MRKLATIRKIDNLLPIEGADLIVTAVIDGWTVVVKKNEFNVGDLCVYFEIDSFLPDGNPSWQHLVDKSSRTFNGKKGHRLRTVKLRGQLSQGFVIPISDTLETEWSHTFLNFEEARPFELGDDVSSVLQIEKYEAPIPTELAGQVHGNFPSFIKKTDQERCQNIVRDIFVDNEDSRYEVTMKMDGTSFTGFYNGETEGVCGRNWQLKVDESNAGNSLVRMYVDSKLQESLAKFAKNYAIQGELQGPNIQGNKEGFTSHKLYVFDIYDIDLAEYLPPHARHEVLHSLYELGLNKDMVQHVPVIAMAESLEDLGIYGITGLLEYAKGPSLHAPIREGLVFKRIDGKFSFKVINNDWLLKHE